MCGTFDNSGDTCGDLSGDLSRSAFPTGIDLAAPALSELLRMGLSAPARPVDRLIERLVRDDGERWLRAALSAGEIWAGGSAQALLLDGEAELETLRVVKGESKRRYRANRSEDDRLAGLLGYVLCLAAALAHHGALISGRPREDVNEILVDLADALPREWRALLERAALR